MKRSYTITLSLTLAGACFWAGRAAWRAHRDLVTLHVRNAPLSQVIASLHRQTWETIVTDSRLDERVTLNIKDAPLIEVLDRLGGQVGGLATAIHAVHESRGALPRLVQELRRGGLSESNGWTHLAPRLGAVGPGPGGIMHEPVESADGGEDLSAVPRPGVPSQGRVVVRREFDRVVEPDSSPASPIEIHGVRINEDGGVHEEIITPEKIVIETGLTNRLKTGDPLAPDLATARGVANEARVRCTTIYTLQKSLVASFEGYFVRKFRFAPAGSAAGGSRQGPPSLEAAAQQAAGEPLRRYQDTTPEQRARRARNRGPEIRP
ncbi:MAG: hypothetical protein KIT22_08160 [Verrucomicrobiae bacterium]|nr:hypothetical protein [Verrucomicrobiae bacterium]